MSGYLTTPWSDFAVAVVGAAAALTGLLFVAVSINIERILAMASLSSRSFSTMTLFTIPLLVGTLVLVPEQSSTALGLELIVTAVAVGGALLWRPVQANARSRNRGGVGCCFVWHRASRSLRFFSSPG